MHQSATLASAQQERSTRSEEESYGVPTATLITVFNAPHIVVTQRPA